MSTRLHAVSVAALDPSRIAQFWAAFLGWHLEDRGGEPWVIPPSDDGFRLRIRRTHTPKTVENLMHLDITSGSEADHADQVARALALGGTPHDVGQSGDEGHVVLADPEGNAFCVIEAGNGFLAGCGLVGALNCDGSRAVGHFWSAALRWPLVWDQDEETAIQSPAGGTKITWSGPPYLSRAGADRWTYDLLTDDDLDPETDRLVVLGARLVEREGGTTTLADPDGNAFTLRAR